MAALVSSKAASSFLGVALKQQTVADEKQSAPESACFTSVPRATISGHNNDEKTHQIRQDHKEGQVAGLAVSRRTALALSLGVAAGWEASSDLVGREALALIPTTAVAGRVPGLSEPDENGLRTYNRPLGKSGGHGVGWSELIPYSFKVPESWEEVPVSIADLGGTEIDLRFVSKQQGNLAVVVAPVLRFREDLGDDAKIEAIGDPERVILAFGPEIVGENVEGKVLDMEVAKYDGRTYYHYEVDPHVLVTATAAGNRLYIMAVKTTGRQWKKYANEIVDISKSFRVAA